jgi:hypothetical protein
MRMKIKMKRTKKILMRRKGQKAAVTMRMRKKIK